MPKKKKQKGLYIKYRKNGKNYKVRIDRMLILLVVLVLLIVLFSACAKSCSKKSNGKVETETAESLTLETESPTSDPSLNTTTIQLSREDLGKGDLVLINADHPYTFAENDLYLESVDNLKNEYYKTSDSSVQLDANVINHINNLMQDFYSATGITDVSVTSGYRSYEDQQQKYDSGSAATPPGESEYHSGRSFSLGIMPDEGSSSYYEYTGDYTWIADNAASYGFIQRYPDGKVVVTGEEEIEYIYRYVGVPHASYMKESHLCLEEYLDMIKNYTVDKPLTITISSRQYSIYYVPASPTGTTAVTVPTSYEYTCSGNNSDGFIVTANTV